jgi:hypothetical protein
MTGLHPDYGLTDEPTPAPDKVGYSQAKRDLCLFLDPDLASADAWGWDDDSVFAAALARLTSLTAERDAWKEQHAAEALGLHVQMQRAEAAEAKLAKAVEAASPLLNMDVWTESAEDAEMVIVSVGTVRRIRATLAEVEGEKT